MSTPVIKIKAEIMWAFLAKKNDMSEKYQVDLCQLSEKAVEALEKLGINVAYKDGKGHYITCKSTNPIRIFDDGGAELDNEMALGNGSEANATIGIYEWEFKNKKGVSPTLRKLVITKVVEYAAAGAEADEDDEIL